VLLANEVFEALRPHAFGERTLAVVYFGKRGCIEEAHSFIMVRRSSYQCALAAGFV
jgi:hypothetical protein